MTNPKILKSLNSLLVNTFGSLENVLEYINLETLNFILSFPGPVHILSPWSLGLHLESYGLSESGQYTILNKDYSFDYTAKVVNYKFGTDKKDLAKVVKTSHADYFFLVADSLPEQTLHLIWVCKTAPVRTTNLFVKGWAAYIETLKSRYNSMQILINVRDIGEYSKLFIHYLPGQWYETVSYKDIVDNPSTKILEYDNTETVITLFPTTSTWFVINTLEDPNIPLKLSAITGSEAQRITQANGTIFVDAGYRPISTALRTTTDLDIRPISSYSSNMSVSKLNVICNLSTFFSRGGGGPANKHYVYAYTNVNINYLIKTPTILYRAVLADEVVEQTTISLITNIIDSTYLNNSLSITVPETTINIQTVNKVRLYNYITLNCLLNETTSSLSLLSRGAPNGAVKVYTSLNSVVPETNLSLVTITKVV